MGGGGEGEGEEGLNREGDLLTFLLKRGGLLEGEAYLRGGLIEDLRYL